MWQGGRFEDGWFLWVFWGGGWVWEGGFVGEEGWEGWGADGIDLREGRVRFWVLSSKEKKKKKKGGFFFIFHFFLLFFTFSHLFLPPSSFYLFLFLFVLLRPKGGKNE